MTDEKPANPYPRRHHDTTDAFTAYSPELAAEICERVGEGESLRSICKDAHMPARRTIMYWAATCEEFKRLLELAYQDRADTYGDEIVELADTPPERVIELNGASRIDAGFVNHLRLRVDTRKWIAGKLKPKRFGDKVTQELTGPDGAALQPPVINLGFANGGPGG